MTEAGVALAGYLGEAGGAVPPPAELGRAGEVFRPAGLARGGFLVHAGEVPDRVALLVRGLMRLTYEDAAGMLRTYAFRAEGDLVCAYSARLRGVPSEMSIEALEDCRLLSAPGAAFDALCAGHEGWRSFVDAVYRERMVQAERRTQALLMDDAPTRYRAFLAERPELAARLTQRQTASYIGVTPEALSRIRRTLT
jgi:CRP-like cAMP-binding protein